MTTQPPTDTRPTQNSISNSSQQSKDDLVEIPVLPPRTTSCYRPTQHFRQRLSERIPSRHHGPVPRDIVENGTVTRQPFDGYPEAGGPGHPVAFVGDVDGDTYTVIAALHPDAYCQPDTVHDLVTVYTGDVLQDAAGDQTGVEQ